MAKKTESKVKPVVIEPNKATPEQIAKGLAMLAKEETRKKRVQAGELKSYSYAEMTPEQKAKAKARDRFIRIKQVLMLQKAQDKGITVSDAEVQAEIKRRGLED